MAADVIFLLSWQIQNGGITVLMIAGAVFFAMQSAVLSVLLEWFYPIRGWKIGCGNCNFTFYMSEASEVMDKK